MKKLFFVLILPSLIWAQLKFIPISADYSSFYDTDTSAFVQVYLSVFQGNLKYTREESGNLVAAFNTQLQILKNGKIIRDITHKFTNTTQDTSRLKNLNRFVDIFNVVIPYGKYQAKLILNDNKSGYSGNYSLDIKTIEPKPDLFLSDLELCTNVTRDTAKTPSVFSKNGLKVVPNPGSVFDLIRPLLFYYVELNNLPYQPGGAQNYYQFDYVVINSKGDTVKHHTPIKKPVKGHTLVEAGGLNILALPQDIYYFTARVTDISSGKTAIASRKFKVNKPQKHQPIQQESQPGTLPAIADYYDTFTKEQLIEEFNAAKYIATRQEMKIFDNLENEQGMKKFLTEFWLRRDKAAGIKPGSTRREYLRRVSYANENFRSMGRKGWMTDRGRVYIMYGPPDEYERHTSSMDLEPYIIWHYHSLEGGAQFIFVDQEGFGDYQLIHSTYRKELQNPNWYEMLRKKTSSGGFFGED